LITREGEWKQQTVRLKAGQNVLQWKTIGMDVHQGKPVLIKSIEISGKSKLFVCFLRKLKACDLLNVIFFISIPENTQKCVMRNG
jgi:hypothetical protein